MPETMAQDVSIDCFQSLLKRAASKRLSALSVCGIAHGMCSELPLRDQLTRLLTPGQPIP